MKTRLFAIFIIFSILFSLTPVNTVGRASSTAQTGHADDPRAAFIIDQTRQEMLEQYEQKKAQVEANPLPAANGENKLALNGTFGGLVTDHGYALAGTLLTLNYWNGSSWVDYAYAMTDANGIYQFNVVPAVDANHVFYVSWENVDGNLNQLYYWNCWLVDQFSILYFGTNSCSFDVADTVLVGGTSTVPAGTTATFYWSKRGVTLENYEVQIVHPSYTYSWESSQLGYTDNLAMLWTEIPAGIKANQPYMWWMNTYTPFGKGVSSYYRTITFSTASPSRVFMPGVFNQNRDLALAMSGRVTYRGTAAAGQQVAFRYYNGTNWSTIGTATTDSNGFYRFSGTPLLDLMGSQMIRATWANNTNNSSYLIGWDCWPVTALPETSGSRTCNFDIENISLVAPAANATVTLPTTFSWQKRYVTDEAYEFDLYNPNTNDGSPWWWNEPQRNASQYTLTSLPQGFATYTPYAWVVYVYGPSGYGSSYFYRTLMFTNRGASSSQPDASSIAIPHQGVEVNDAMELRPVLPMPVEEK